MMHLYNIIFYEYIYLAEVQMHIAEPVAIRLLIKLHIKANSPRKTCWVFTIDNVNFLNIRS